MTTFYQTQGTSIVWTSSGGDKELDLSSLANNNGVQGEANDFGVNHSEKVRILLEVDFNAAPTAGLLMNVYWSSSHDNSNYDGECVTTGSAYSSDDDARRLWPVGNLAASNDTNPHRASWVFFLPARYGLPVVINKSGQVLTATGTDQIVTVTPMNITDGA